MFNNYSQRKILLKKILCFKPINSLMQYFVKPLMPFLPKAFSRIPVVGKVRVTMYKKFFFMESFGNDTIAAALFWKGLEGFEYETTSILEKLLKPHHIFFDVGANTGVYSFLAATKVQQVYSFEPAPSIYNAAQHNLQLNTFHNLKMYPYAISDSVGKIHLHVPRSTAIPTSSSIVANFKQHCQKVEVPCQTIDFFVEENAINTVDFLKIDVEGAESQVLEGARKTICQHNPYVICEVLPNQDKGIQNFFQNLAYSFFWLAKEVVEIDKIVGHSDYLNYLLVPDKRLKEFRKSVNIQK